MGGPPSPATPRAIGAPPPPAGALTITFVSGAVMTVLSIEEKAFFDSVRDAYLAQHVFTAVTDMQDLDRLLLMELMTHRWTRWMASGRDEHGQLIDGVDLRRAYKDYSTQITAVKNAMGLSRAEREKESHASVGAYIIQLKQAGKHFGVHREAQATKGIALMMEAMSLAGTHRRCNALERQKLGLEAQDIVDWINDVAGPEMTQVDTDFRANQQRYWRL
jgi:hypothetical protein